MRKIEITACAKINLGLNVIRKREDGFHDIQTVFYPLDLADKVIFSESDRFEFYCSNEALNNDPDNLVLKAKNILEQNQNRRFTSRIVLEKNIPVGAGLGGGSSDAAAVLKGLNHFFNLNLGDKIIRKYAENLGSDVPFFLDPKPCFASSRGEKTEEINLNIEYPILIVNPGIQISTKWGYENIKPKSPKVNLKELFRSEKIDFLSLKGIITNDFEIPVFEKFPVIAEIKSGMYFMGALFALMTGTGSTIFGVFPDRVSVENANEVFRRKYFTFIHYE